MSISFHRERKEETSDRRFKLTLIPRSNCVASFRAPAMIFASTSLKGDARASFSLRVG